MVTNDIGKLIGLMVCTVVIGVLLWGGRIDDVAGAGLLGIIVGYFAGNGVNAVRRRAPSPVLVPKVPDDQLDDAVVESIVRRLLAETAAEQAHRQGWPDPPGRHHRPAGALPPWRPQ